MSDVLHLKPWMILTGYQRRFLKLRRRPLTVCSLVQLNLRASLTLLLFHTGKSASFSQAALSAINIDVDTSRLLDIVSPFTTRTLKERKSNKENITKTVSPAPIGKSDPKSEFVMVETSEVLKKVTTNAAERPSSLSLVAPPQKKKHTRSQSQPKAAVKPGSLFYSWI